MGKRSVEEEDDWHLYEDVEAETISLCLAKLGNEEESIGN